MLCLDTTELFVFFFHIVVSQVIQAGGLCAQQLLYHWNACSKSMHHWNVEFWLSTELVLQKERESSRICFCDNDGVDDRDSGWTFCSRLSLRGECASMCCQDGVWSRTSARKSSRAPATISPQHLWRSWSRHRFSSSDKHKPIMSTKISCRSQKSGFWFSHTLKNPVRYIYYLFFPPEASSTCKKSSPSLNRVAVFHHTCAKVFA